MNVERVGIVVRTGKAEFVFPSLSFPSLPANIVRLLGLIEGVAPVVPAAVTDRELATIISRLPNADAILTSLAALWPAAIITGDSVQLTGDGWEVVNGTARWRKVSGPGSTNFPYTPLAKGR